MTDRPDVPQGPPASPRGHDSSAEQGAAAWLGEFARDLRYSVRTLLRSPAYTVFASLVLALGIGAATAMFSAVNAVVLARLPYPSDEQLVRIFQQNSPTHRWTLSAVDVQAIEQYAQSFSAIGAVRFRDVGVTARRSPERHSAGYVNAGFLNALDLTLAAGRRFVADDERTESPAVVVLGHAYALQEFGSATAAVNQAVTIDGVVHRVVGVLKPADARLANWRADLWPVLRRVTPNRRGPFGIMALARLRPGMTVETARHELDAISVRIFPQWQAGFQDKVARLTPYSLRETLLGDARRPLALFTAAVAMVLLIAVTNVASLSIVRSMRRAREISLRAMLGASEGRLVRLMITESVVLSFAGAVLGIAIGWFALKGLQQFAVGIPRLDTASLDGRAVAVAFAVAVAAGCIIGIIPALRFLRKNRDDKLRDGTRAIGDGEHAGRLRSAFVAAEFALALPVLAAGGLLLNSLLQLQQVNPGFDARGVYSVRVSVPPGTYRQSADIAGFWTRVARNVSDIPGVAAAGFATAVPPNDQGNNNDNYDLVESPVPPGAAQPTVTWPSVNNEFFAALRLPLLEGRSFAVGDSASEAPVAVVTKSWAARQFPGRSAVGRELIRGGCTACPHTAIVGVVGDITFDALGAPADAVFSPVTSGWPTQLNLFVRTARTNAALALRVREAVRAADPSAAMGALIAMEEGLYESMAQPRHWATILLVFAAAALMMAAVGVFGLLSYAVELRRREIGVRMALGATSRSVVASMIGGGMRHAVTGSVIGILVTLGAARWLNAMLYKVSAFDVTTLVVVTVGLLAVALVASWLPARRAAMIDPVEAMRPE